MGDAAAAALLARPPSAARPRTADGADAVRGRSLRNLTVNVFHPIELLPAAWSTLDFPWEPERDDEREEGLATAAEVVGYAERRLADWTDFVLEHADDLGEHDPVVSSPRGELRFSALLDSQLEHVSFHHAQLVEFLSTLSV